MKYFLLAAIAVFSLSISSCKKKNNYSRLITVDSMILKTMNMCGATMKERVFVLANGAVREDKSNYSNDPRYNSFSGQLDTNTAANVLPLLNEVPEKLLDKNNYSFSGDNSKFMTVVQAYKGGTMYEWTFYGVASSDPDYQKTFFNSVYNALSFLPRC